MAIHVKAAGNINAYVHLERRNYVALGRAARADLTPRAAHFLPYNNLLARIRYARLMGEHLERVALTLPPDPPLFFVTLINREHTIPRRHGARSEFIARVIGWTHSQLLGCHYVGMVEAAYYSNLRTLSGYERRYLSWHTHLILWGVTEAELAARIEQINRRYLTAIPGRTAAHYRAVQIEEVFGQGLYMSKGQISEYRVWPKTVLLFNEQTGEVRKFLSGSFRSKKRSLRPGDGVHLCNVFANRYINDFAFAAGDGRAVLDEVNRVALAEFNRWEARQPYKIAEERRRAERRRASR